MSKAIPFEDIEINLCGLITIVGLSNSGKTTLLRSIMHKLLDKGLYRTYLFSSTADIYRNTDYDFCMPKNVRKINMNKIKQLKEIQEVIVKKAANDKRIEPKWIAIILDDFIGDDECNLMSKMSKIISQLAVSGRHYKICTIVLSQHLNKLPPVIRQQSNYIFVTKVRMETVMDGIYPMQTQYTNKQQLWHVYSQHTKTRYASMMLQTDDPYVDNIKFLMPSKKVSFIDDKDSYEITKNKLDDFEGDNSDSNNSSNDETSLSDDGASVREDSVLSLTDSIGSTDNGIF